MPAIPWLPGDRSAHLELEAGPAGLFQLRRPVLGPTLAVNLAMPVEGRTREVDLRLLPAASVILWEDFHQQTEEGEEGTDRGPGTAASEDPFDLRRRLLAALQPPLGLCLRPDGILDWPHEPMPFQLQGIRTLIERESLLLADEMGLGKTVQALAALRLLALRHEVASCLIVAPAAVFSQWRDQFAAWAPELRLSPVRGGPAERDLQWRTAAHAHLVGFETLRADLALAAGRTWDLVMVDEAQRIKNAGSEVAAAVKRLSRKRSWALTGTPLENRLEDLVSILEFVEPTLEIDAARARIPSLLSGLQLRRRKAEVLEELPPRTWTELLLPMPSVQRAAYERMEKDGLLQLREMGPAIGVQTVLELIVRLKQLCNFDPVSGTSAKLRDLEDRLEELSETDERALVFSQFTDTTYGVEAISRRLARFRPLELTGAMSHAAREQTVDRFRSDSGHRVLILSLQAGGVGLNLQDASYVFVFDRWWNPAIEDQAAARSHRLGQMRPVHVYSYALEGTIEERILRILAGKRDLFEAVVEGSGLTPASALSREDLLRVVGLD